MLMCTVSVVGVDPTILADSTLVSAGFTAQFAGFKLSAVVSYVISLSVPATSCPSADRLVVIVAVPPCGPVSLPRSM